MLGMASYILATPHTTTVRLQPARPHHLTRRIFLIHFTPYCIFRYIGIKLGSMKIDREVPIPKSKYRKQGRWGTGTPWADAARRMKSGDSVLVQTHNEARCLRLALQARQKYYCQRTVKNGYRVWCLIDPDLSPDDIPAESERILIQEAR